MSEFSVVITAGGIGKRMGTAVPKQFLELNGKPVLLHTLEKFHSFDPTAQLLITLPYEWKTYWDDLLIKFNCDIPHQVVDGGEERYHSIKNALKMCSGKYVAIHDGVRPLVNEETLKRCFEAVKTNGQVIPVVPLKESIRKVTEDGSHAEDRSLFRLVQTPQCFLKEVLENAYQKEYHTKITDDAGLVEEAGYKIYLVAGNEENIKITTLLDLEFASMLMGKTTYKKT
jgi:2-C-methyl-D-erythritol 4-phosphate cytidylyltransferase